MIKLQVEDFDVSRELSVMLSGHKQVGGVCTFVGLVREYDSSEPLNSLTLEHYPEMTKKELIKIEKQAKEKWTLKDSLIIHRYGRLVPSDQIVFVATASAHRRDAFNSCEYIVDYLKTRAPFWKKEEYKSRVKWVEARSSDEDSLNKWKEVAS